MLRKAITFALLGVMILGTAAFAVEIEFWHAMSSRHQENLQVLLDKFHEENPDITVVATYQGRYSDLEAKIGASVVAGTLPTIAQVYENWVTPIAEILVPIGNYMTAEEQADIIDGLVPSNTYNGVLTTVPFNKSIMVLYYDAGVIETPPATWAEFVQMAMDLSVDTDGDGVIDRYGVGTQLNAEHFLNFLSQAGGTILNEDWTEVAINNAAGLAAAEHIAAFQPYTFVTSEYLSNHFPLACSMFIDTSAGYYYNNQAAVNAETTMGVARVPAGPGGQSSMIQGTNLAVFGTENWTQEQIDAAVAFAKFLIRADNTVFWAIRSGYQPVTKSAYETQEWVDFVEENPYQQAMSAQMLDGISQILHPNYGDFRPIISLGYEELMEGVATPQEAVDNMASELELLLED